MISKTRKDNLRELTGLNAWQKRKHVYLSEWSCEEKRPSLTLTLKSGKEITGYLTNTSTDGGVILNQTPENGSTRKHIDMREVVAIEEN